MLTGQPMHAQTSSSFQIQPTSSVAIPSGIGNINYPEYQIESGVTCPTAALNFTGFASNVDGSTSYIDRYGSSGTYGNYGGALSLSFPLANKSFVENCKKASQAKAKKATLDTWSTLINNCAAFAQKGITDYEKMPGIPEEFKLCGLVRLDTSGSQRGGTFVEPSKQVPQLNIERFVPPQNGTFQLLR